MSDCLNCIKAKQCVEHTTYTSGCPLCGARKLAYMAPRNREQWLDRIERENGRRMRIEAERMCREERARMDRLGRLTRHEHFGRTRTKKEVGQ